MDPQIVFEYTGIPIVKILPQSFYLPESPCTNYFVQKEQHDDVTNLMRRKYTWLPAAYNNVLMVRPDGHMFFMVERS